MLGPLDGHEDLRPESWIGVRAPRANALRLLQGRGTYVDDIVLPRMVHVVFLRSPYAHARIRAIDAGEAISSPGVVAIFTGRDFVDQCRPWTGVLSHLVALRSVPQYPLAVDRALWQGEPVVAIVAETVAQAEDALQLVAIDWEELDPVTDPEKALTTNSPVIHAELGDNLAYARVEEMGDVEEAFRTAQTIIEAKFETGRHTGVCLETRSILADFNPADHTLVVYLSSQVPHMMQSILARHLGIEENNVRVICRDVGGGFGIKVHVYGDEMAAAAIAIRLKRPVKFVADRLESFVSDVHSRDHLIKARLAVSRDGKMLGIDFDDLSGIGAYSVYPRGSANEIKQILNLVGAPYHLSAYRGKGRLAFQNKNQLGQYRAVGHPIACLITEGLVDRGARAIGMDPLEFRTRNVVPDNAYPHRTPGGVLLEALSHERCLASIAEMMDYEGLRREQAALREKGV